MKPPYKHLIILCNLLWVFPSFISANNIQVVSVEPNATFTTLTVELTWKNTWYYSSGSQDAAWVFVKYKNKGSSQWRHLTIDAIQSSNSNDGAIRALTIQREGAYISHDNIYGDTASANAHVEFVIEIGDSVTLEYPSFRVFAIEMVDPDGFSDPQVGDGSSENRFYTAGDTTDPYVLPNPFVASISIGQDPGELYSTDGTLESGTLSVNYPRQRYQFIMKHEISQMQYVQFLNCLTRGQQNNRTETDINEISNTNRYVMSDSPTMVGRNGIARDIGVTSGPLQFYCDLNENENPNEIDDGQNIACNYLSPADLQAYCDWACLRPLSELEYEVLSRGGEPSVMDEFAWGSTVVQPVTIVNAGRPDEMAVQAGSDGLVRSTANGPMRCGFAAGDSTGRIQAGAAVSGILDMTGNVAELVTSIALVSDRGFEWDDVGDGVLSTLGNANEPTWPTNMTIRGRAVSNSDIWTVSRRGIQFATGRNMHNGGRGLRPGL